MGRDRTRLERLENLQNSFSVLTPTLNYVIVADGITFNSVPMSGDATIASTGAVTVSKISGVTFNVVPNTGFVLVADGTQWNAVGVSGDVGFDATGLTVVTALNTVPLGSAPSNDGQIMIWRNTNFWNAVDINGDATLDHSGLLTVIQINGNPLGDTSVTSGNVFIANGAVWNSIALIGDISVTSGGATTIKNNVALGGNPTTTTQAALNNSTRIATTAYVNAEVNAIGQYFAPATGGTVSPTAPQMLSNVFINPAAGIAALTLTLPTGTLQGQILWVAFTQIVTALVVTATNIGTHGIASPTTAIATSSFAWAWDNTAARWNRFF